MNKIYEWIDKLWQWIAETVFVRFEFDLPVEDLHKLSTSGRVVFALTQGGFVEWLILSSWCRSQNLGAILVANRKRILLLSKPKYFFQILFRRTTYADLYLKGEGGPRLLFCPNHERKQLFEPTQVERILSELYSSASTQGILGNVTLVPVFIRWRKHMRRDTRTPSEYLLGMSTAPNLIGKIWYLIRARLDSVVQSLGFLYMTPPKEALEGAEPLLDPLAPDVDEEAEPMRVAKSTRRKIIVLTQQEMRVVLGPRYHSHHLVKETLLRDPDILEVIREVSEQEGVDKRKVMSRAYQIFTEIVANYSFRFIEVMFVVLSWLFTRVFDGLSFEESEFQKVREIMKSKPVVFVPCHRSHLDYLVIPYVMFINDMVPPHTAAGINLGFWPIGPFLRMGGAFFIRRSFRGDRLYTVCLKKYVEYLLKNRFNVKFFIEGTRSRSGKMLAPAYGMLKMILEAYQHKVCDDIVLVPVSLCYDEVPEQGSYSKELGGAQKTKESAKGLVKSKEIIKRNFGKVYVRLADPLYAKEIYQSAEAGTLDPTLLLQKTAFQLCKNINDVTPITPKSLVSCVLLGHPMSTVSLQEILRLTEMLRQYVEWCHLPLSTEPGDPFRRAIEQTVRRLQKNNVLSVSESERRAYYCENRKRILLNFYKNNAMHCLVTPAIALLSLLETLKSKESGPAGERILHVASQVRNLLKFEFFFSPTPIFVSEIEANLDLFLKGDWREKTGRELSALVQTSFPEWSDVALYLRLLGELLESYVTALSYLKENPIQGPIEKKALLQKMAKSAEAKTAEGQISFPESVSTQNYANALQLFENLGLLAFKREQDKMWIEIQPWGPATEALRAQFAGLLSLMEEPPSQFMRVGNQWSLKPLTQPLITP